MLSDHEREALLAIEHRMLAEDPGWTLAFDAPWRRMSRRPTPGRSVRVLALVLAAALTMLMLVAHAPGAALFFATATGSLIWLVRRTRSVAGRREPDDEPGSGHPVA